MQSTWWCPRTEKVNASTLGEWLQSIIKYSVNIEMCSLNIIPVQNQTTFDTLKSDIGPASIKAGW